MDEGKSVSPTGAESEEKLEEFFAKHSSLGQSSSVERMMSYPVAALSAPTECIVCFADDIEVKKTYDAYIATCRSCGKNWREPFEKKDEELDDEE